MAESHLINYESYPMNLMIARGKKKELEREIQFLIMLIVWLCD